MPGPRGSTTHHCPRRSHGNCRKGKTSYKAPYCTKHQTYCAAHKKSYLQTEDCPECAGAAAQKAAAQKAAAEKAAAEKAAAEKAAAEKAAAEKAAAEKAAAEKAAA
ncbi:hypothetical protein KCU81_g2849, partial [Aureobasidium melanogenum]